MTKKTKTEAVSPRILLNSDHRMSFTITIDGEEQIEIYEQDNEALCFLRNMECVEVSREILPEIIRALEAIRKREF